MHDIGLLVELVAVYIFDAKPYIIIKIKISTIGYKNTTIIKQLGLWRS